MTVSSSILRTLKARSTTGDVTISPAVYGAILDELAAAETLEVVRLIVANWMSDPDCPTWDAMLRITEVVNPQTDVDQ